MSAPLLPGNVRASADKTADSPVWTFVPLAAIVLGVIARMVIRTSTSLWEDEVIAATHATQSFPKVIADLIVNDIHPPLYFLELHIWSLFGHSDVWLIANSILLSIVAVVSLFLVVRRMSGATAALVATAVFSVLPVPLWMAGEVRMYAWLSVLFIWLYYFTHKAFAFPRSAIGSRIAVVFLSLAVVYSHAIGFVAIFFYGIYAAGLLAARKAASRDWLIGLAVFGGIGVAAMPMPIAGLFHHADMGPIRSFKDILTWMASIVTGNGYETIPWLYAAGLIAYVAVTVLGVLVLRTRRLTLCFLVAPVAFCIIVGIAAKPLFKTNFFSNLCSPFLALVIGNLLIAMPLRKTARTAIFACILASLLAMAIVNREALNASNTYYRQIADLITAEKQPGDVVWAPQMSIFWGMAWYLAGPGWGSPDAINVPLRPQSGWWKVFGFLGPKLVKELDLIPTSQTIVTKDGLPIMVAAASQSRAEQASRVWLVTYARSDLPPGLPADDLGPLHRIKSFSFPPIQVNLYGPPERK